MHVGEYARPPGSRHAFELVWFDILGLDSQQRLPPAPNIQNACPFLALERTEPSKQVSVPSNDSPKTCACCMKVPIAGHAVTLACISERPDSHVPRLVHVRRDLSQGPPQHRECGVQGGVETAGGEAGGAVRGRGGAGVRQWTFETAS